MHTVEIAAPFPKQLNPKAKWVWKEVVSDGVAADKRISEFRSRCALYGMQWQAVQKHNNDTIRRYLVRNRMETVKEIALFYHLIGSVKPKDIRHILTVHEDLSFNIRGEIDFYKVGMSVSTLKKALLHTQAYQTYYRRKTATEVQKSLLRNRLVTLSVQILNQQRITFAYEIVVKQPVWLPETVEPTKAGIASFIESKLWYPIAMVHRVKDIKLRSYI